MARTVFILGAGASVAAGAPVQATFLATAQQLRSVNRLQRATDELECVERAISVLQGCNAKTQLDTTNLERLWTALEMAQLLGGVGALSSEDAVEALRSLRKLIVVVLEESIRFPSSSNGVHAFAAAPAGYSSLSNEILRRMRKQSAGAPTLITFNYDIALEVALDDNQIKYDYGHESSHQEPHVDLLKLHGSVNWYQKENVVQVTPIERMGFGQAGVHHLTLQTSLPVNPQTGVVYEPLIVPPTDSKKEGRFILANVWKRAAQELRTAARLVVIGYSMPQSDEFFRTFLALSTLGPTAISEVIVVDPSPDTANRIRGVLGTETASRFQHIPCTFADAAPRIQEWI